MAKAYAIIQIRDNSDVTSKHRPNVQRIREKYQGELLVGTNSSVSIEDNTLEGYTTYVFSFPDIESANSFYNDPVNQDFKTELKQTPGGDFKGFTVEGNS
jgi:uncharacterized protein (DUF1330 family)